MNSKFVKAFGSIQDLFQQLNNNGKVSPKQAELFDEAQKDIINYHSWVKNQLDGNIKAVLPWDAPEFIEAWKLWKNFKKEKGFTYKPIGEQSALSHLQELSKGDMNTAIEILKRSRGNGWSGMFPLPAKSSTKRLVQNQNDDYKQQLISRLGGEK